MLVKSFTDDLAWQVQRQLVKAYFRQQKLPSNVYFLIPKTLPEALRLAADLAEKNEALQAKIEQDKPKVQFHDEVADAINGQTVQDAAKMLGTGRNRLFKGLRKQGLLMYDNQPYPKYIDCGYFRVIQRQCYDEHGKSRTSTRILITGKGLTFILRRFCLSSISAA